MRRFWLRPQTTYPPAHTCWATSAVRYTTGGSGRCCSAAAQSRACTPPPAIPAGGSAATTSRVGRPLAPLATAGSGSGPGSKTAVSCRRVWWKGDGVPEVETASRHPPLPLTRHGLSRGPGRGLGGRLALHGVVDVQRRRGEEGHLLPEAPPAWREWGKGLGKGGGGTQAPKMETTNCHAAVIGGSRAESFNSEDPYVDGEFQP